MKIKKIVSLVLVAVGLVIIAISIALPLLKKDKATTEEDKDLVYNLEKSLFYKEIENDGKKEIVDIDEDDFETNCFFTITIPGKYYKETKFDKDNPYFVKLVNKEDKFTFDVTLDSGKFLDYHDIVVSDTNEYEKIDIKEDYEVGNTKVLRKEYVVDGKKHLEYYYLYKSGLYIEYSFEAKKNYNYNYQELEKLFSFEIKEQQL